MLKVYKRLVLHYYSLTKEKSNSIILASTFVAFVAVFMIDIILRLTFLKEGIVRNKLAIVVIYLTILALSVRLFKSYSKDKMEGIIKHHKRYSRKRSGIMLVGSIIVIAIATGLYVLFLRTLEY